jgi:hypothetical protein
MRLGVTPYYDSQRSLWIAFVALSLRVGSFSEPEAQGRPLTGSLHTDE